MLVSWSIVDIDILYLHRKETMLLKTVLVAFFTITRWYAFVDSMRLVGVHDVKFYRFVQFFRCATVFQPPTIHLWLIKSYLLCFSFLFWITTKLKIRLIHHSTHQVSFLYSLSIDTVASATTGICQAASISSLNLSIPSLLTSLLTYFRWNPQHCN